jgi:hypothetical protein
MKKGTNRKAAVVCGCVPGGATPWYGSQAGWDAKKAASRNLHATYSSRKQQLTYDITLLNKCQILYAKLSIPKTD